MALTQQQAEAKQKIKAFLNDPEQKTFGLFGYAGTGKTFVTSDLIKDYPGQVLMTASTNKAVSVMKYMWRKAKMPPQEFCTTYKLFGYYIQPALNRETGEWEEKLVKSQSWVPPFDDAVGNIHPLLIIDEASMINRWFYDKLMEYIPYFDLKILFIGDPGQLPPVKEDISPVFERIGTEDSYVMLTDIVRQSKESHILKTATEIRKDLSTQAHDITSYTTPDNIVSSREELAKIAMESFLEKGSFLHTKIVAWRNDTVDWYNNYVRTTLRPAVKTLKECPFIVGDPVIAKKAVYKGRDTLLYTSQEMIVKAIKESKKAGISTFELILESEYEPTTKVHIVKQSNLKTFQSKCKWYKDKAKKTNSDVDWMIYKQFAFGFADLDYSFAITSHKSQGSTYKNVFVDVNDILMNHKITERNKCLYVAVSRPTDKLLMRK